MKNSYSKQAIEDLLEEVAEVYGMTVEEYLSSQLKNADDERAKQREGMPEEILKELEYASAARKAERDSKRRKEADEKISGETAAFKELFPDVSPDEIPDEVWSAVENGESLTGAYAIYFCRKLISDSKAEKANKDAASRAAAPAGKGDTEPEYTREMVERMSNKEIAGNFGGILASMKKWKI